MSALPAPRLQLRWRKPTKRELKRASVGHLGDYPWTCEYELILPLQDGDIRRTDKRHEHALQISRTFSSKNKDDEPDYAPFRDGVHAKWDSEALRGLPVYVITPSGRAILQPNSACSSGQQ